MRKEDANDSARNDLHAIANALMHDTEVQYQNPSAFTSINRISRQEVYQESQGKDCGEIQMMNQRGRDSNSIKLPSIKAKVYFPY